jgi:hypothetical protein
MRYTITGIFAAAATAAIAGIATANPWAIAFAGVAAGSGVAMVGLYMFGEIIDGFLRNNSYRPKKPTLAGYALGAALGVAAGLGVNAATQPTAADTVTQPADPSTSQVQPLPPQPYRR